MTVRPDVLDLYDLALLLTYERFTVEPRFRHAKLTDMAEGATDFATVKLPSVPEWSEPGNLQRRRGFFFEIDPKDESDTPDLPSTMLPSVVPLLLQDLSRKKIETIFWQARTHESCASSLALLQYLFELYRENQPILVRSSDGDQFVAFANMQTVKFELYGANQLTMSVVTRGADNCGYITGGLECMPHVTMMFEPASQSLATATNGNPNTISSGNFSSLTRGRATPTILDLSSMQFGDVGRGLGGRSLFVLESLDKFVERMRLVARRVEGPVAASVRYLLRPDQQWLRDVAQRVKQRYARRATEHWCGHCGAPAVSMACAKCTLAWYCDREHQVAAWPFHKHYCAGRAK